ncbi:hypothetical protein, conserved [Leishmania tarentolae]|uniref:EF-hand domain-containing protein n=1 Tax=Leishmania tarentolae TaxID=5689 RepID=A0A640KH82_LEITA|nr:hypothetical protein, conserved [Leishmania tarentolae]
MRTPRRLPLLLSLGGPRECGKGAQARTKIEQLVSVHALHALVSQSLWCHRAFLRAWWRLYFLSTTTAFSARARIDEASCMLLPCLPPPRTYVHLTSRYAPGDLPVARALLHLFASRHRQRKCGVCVPEMAYIRRALLLAGVSTASYACLSDRRPATPPSHIPLDTTRRSTFGLHGGSSSSKSADEDVIDVANGKARTASVTEVFVSLYICACGLLGMSTPALIQGTATAAAASVAGVDAVVNTTTAESVHPSLVSSDEAVVPPADRHFSDATEAEKRVADFRTDAGMPSSASTQSDLHERTAVFRTIPHKLKDRFLHYAKRDPETGEFVLSLEGFVRCMLLVSDDSGAVTHKSPSTTFSDTANTEVDAFCAKAISDRGQLPCHSSWMQQLPANVQQRFVQLFRWVDLNGNNFIGYAEFVVLFTFLSTPQHMLQRAFSVFDMEGRGRLSEWEFCHLLNTIMVDPAVQVRYTAATSGVSDGGGDDAAASPASATPQPTTTRETPYLASCFPPTPSTAKTAVASVASVPHSSTARRAGTWWRSKQQWRSQRDCLNFEISSELMRPLLFGHLPLHVGDPPGSMGYDREAARANGVVPSPCELSGLTDVGHSVWWRQWSDTLCRLLGKLWTLYPVRAPVSCDAACRTLGGAPIAAPLAVAAAAPPPRMPQLQIMAQEDSLLHMVSYPTLLYRLNYLRWELRAIEFGLCDPDNTGTISLDDCRRLLRGDVRRIVKAGHAALQKRRQQGDDTAVTWQLYQKMLDVMCDSDRILAALRLTLDAMPPVPEETLRGGAIPDEALEAATHAIPAMVRLSVLHHATRTTREGAAADVVSLPETAEVETSPADGRHVACCKPLTPTDAMATSTAECRGMSETCALARQLQTPLVRPTALTWNQWRRVLVVLGTVTHLSESEQSLFCALLDDDGSDSLSLAEFERMCTLKETFFAQSLPRYDEPKRTAVQQFLHCMQQLE